MIEPPGFVVLYTIYFSHLRNEWVYAVRLANEKVVMREGSEIGLVRPVPEGGTMRAIEIAGWAEACKQLPPHWTERDRAHVGNAIGAYLDAVDPDGPVIKWDKLLGIVMAFLQRNEITMTAEQVKAICANSTDYTVLLLNFTNHMTVKLAPTDAIPAIVAAYQRAEQPAPPIPPVPVYTLPQS